MKLSLVSLIACALLGALGVAHAAPPPPADDGLQAQIEELKGDVLALNRDLLILEEELLYPSNSQLAVFLSMDVGTFFQLDAVKLKVDDRLVAASLYTERQVDALFRGGVQRLYLGNLKSGEHEITAIFTGVGPAGRAYRRGATLQLRKEEGPALLELKIVDAPARQQPEFHIVEWSQ